jgi:hypothetical protein
LGLLALLLLPFLQLGNLLQHLAFDLCLRSCSCRFYHSCNVDGGDGTSQQLLSASLMKVAKHCHSNG